MTIKEKFPLTDKSKKRIASTKSKTNLIFFYYDNAKKHVTFFARFRTNISVIEHSCFAFTYKVLTY